MLYGTIRTEGFISQTIAESGLFKIFSLVEDHFSGYYHLRLPKLKTVWDSCKSHSMSQVGKIREYKTDP